MANPVSHEPIRRTGSFAVATITAALAIWATTSNNVLQSLFLSLSYAIHRTLRGCRWSTVHRKQLYQRSSAHSAPHAPSLTPSPPSRAPSPPFRRPRTRHPRASATTTSGRVTQARTPRPCREPSRETTVMPGRSNSSSNYCQPRDTSSPSKARRRRRRRQRGSRCRRRRRRRGRHSSTAGRHCHDVNRRAPSFAALASPLLPLPRRRRHRRCHRQLSQWSWPLRRSRSPAGHPRTSPRKSASWSVAVARTAESLLSSIAPLEGRGSRRR